MIRILIISLLIFLQGYLTPAFSQGVQSHPDEVVAILGDSNTWLGKDDCTGKRAWTYEWVRLYAPASARSYARSGATWTNVPATKRNVEQVTGVLADDNTIYNQVQRLSDAVNSGEQVMPTLIIIMAGTNDAWFASKRPGAFDMSVDDAMESCSDSALVKMSPGAVTTLPLSIRHNVALLRRMAPDAAIVLLGPLQSVQAPDQMIRKAGEIIENSAEVLGVPAIRLDRDFELDSSKEAVKKHLTYDGTHTSEEGARLLGQFLAQRIGELRNK